MCKTFIPLGALRGGGGVAVALTLWACADDPTAPPMSAPTPTRYGLAAFEDLNPDPDVVEVNLEASHEHAWDLGAGVSVHGLAYNGSHPGPLLEAKLGDKIIVHFENDLPFATSVHWHGLRVPSAMDGTMLVQQPVEPGGRFDYAFEARDVGFYWYHPHMHEAAQVELGLYGPILIHAPGEPALSLDQPMVFDDILLGDDGEILGLDPHAHEPEGSHPDPDTLDRLGNHLLVNGKTNVEIPVTKGGWALFRLLNTSDARFLVVRLEGHEMTVVGLDGGFLRKPYPTKSIVMGVGERYLVLVQLNGERGKSYDWIHTKYDGQDPFDDDPLPAKPTAVARLVYGSDEVATSERPTFPADGAPDMGLGGDITHTWTISEKFESGEFLNTIDGQVWPNVPLLTYPADGDYTFAIETTGDPHPFHIHGNSFQVVEVNGKEVDYRAWKDTVTVERSGSVRIRARFDNPGRWMYHCHILPHQEAGMMAEMVVE